MAGCVAELSLGSREMLEAGIRLPERGEMVDSGEGEEVLLEKGEGRMKRILIEIKEACQYVGIILLACGAAGWLIFKRMRDKR